MDYKDKAAFITGAAQGIGKAYAESLLEKGCKVCLTDIQDEQGRATCDELQDTFGKKNVMFVKCDVTSMDEMKAAFLEAVSAFKYIDIFINNAGIVQERKMELCVDVNLQGVMRGVSLALDHMLRDKGGHGGTIVNTCSIAVKFPSNFLPVYSGTKWGIAGFGKSWALHPDVINSGIRIICICPAVVDTPIQKLTDEQIHGRELLEKLRDEQNHLSASDIGTALIKVLEDKDNNGSLLNVEYPDSGIQMTYMKFPNEN